MHASVTAIRQPIRSAIGIIVLGTPLIWFVTLLVLPNLAVSFHVTRLHELVNWLNFALVPVLGVLALATHLARGQRRTATIAFAAFAFAASFPLHRLFRADQNTLSFLFYGTIGRLVFVFACWRIVLADRIVALFVRRRNVAIIVIIALGLAMVRLLFKVPLDDLADDRSGESEWLRRVFEVATALGAGLVAFGLSRDEKRLPGAGAPLLTLAFVVLAEQTLFFLASPTPDLFWWSGNLMWAAANLLLIGSVVIAADSAPNLHDTRDVVMPGSFLGGYEVLEPIGEGGMGRVFKARHRRLKRIVAIKVIRPDRLSRAENVYRFQREARAAAALEHPNVVRVFDAAEVDGTHFLVMEYVEGTDLAELIRLHGALPIGLACHYAQQACFALQHAYERGLVHRDIKPANLLITADGHGLKVLDMGVARFQDAAAGDLSAGELTQTGAVMGTPAYLAPEQARDSRHVDIRGDLYSLGCTLYHLLTGTIPFRGATLAEMVLCHQMEEPPSLVEVRPELASAIDLVVQKMMAKRPEDRYQTPADAADALAPFASFNEEEMSTWMNNAEPAPAMNPTTDTHSGQ